MVWGTHIPLLIASSKWLILVFIEINVIIRKSYWSCNKVFVLDDKCHWLVVSKFRCKKCGYFSCHSFLFLWSVNNSNELDEKLLRWIYCSLLGFYWLFFSLWVHAIPYLSFLISLLVVLFVLSHFFLVHHHEHCVLFLIFSLIIVFWLPIEKKEY